MREKGSFSGPSARSKAKVPPNLCAVKKAVFIVGDARLGITSHHNMARRRAAERNQFIERGKLIFEPKTISKMSPPRKAKDERRWPYFDQDIHVREVGSVCEDSFRGIAQRGKKPRTHSSHPSSQKKHAQPFCLSCIGRRSLSLVCLSGPCWPRGGRVGMKWDWVGWLGCRVPVSTENAPIGASTWWVAYAPHGGATVDTRAPTTEEGFV